jgi:PAS domain S-box-containing protein
LGYHVLTLSAQEALGISAYAEVDVVLLGPLPDRITLTRALAAPPERHVVALIDDPLDAEEETIACLNAGACAAWPRGLPARLLAAKLDALRRTIHQGDRAAPIVTEQERCFRSFANGMPFILWTATPDGTLDYASRAFYALTGADTRRPIGDIWLSTLHPEDIPRVAALWAEHVQNELPYNTIFRLQSPDGWRWHHAVAAPVRDVQGRCIRWVGATLDIHETKLLDQQALRDAARPHAMLESITDGFLTIDRAFVMTYVNQHGAKLLHSTPAHIIGKNVWEQYPTARGTIAQRCYEAAMHQRIPQQFEYRDEVLNLWLEVRVYPSDEGIAVIFNDITERRMTEQQLSLLRACVERVNDLIIVTDAEPIDMPGPRIRYVNQAFERVTGYTSAEVLGKTPRLLQGPNSQRPALDRIRHALATWQPIREELINYTKDGRELWLEIDLSPVNDETGRFTHWVAIERDITERKRAQLHALQAQRVETVAALTSGVAHDLNNILTPILSLTSLLLAEQRYPDISQELATIEACAQQGARLLSQLLLFARSGKHSVHTQLSLSALARDVLALMRVTLPPHITVTLHAPDDLWPITGDHTQLQQLLTNLILNARDAMPDGGQLTITLANITAHTPAHHLHLPKPGPHVLLQVEDTGIGIPRDIHERIFEPFFTTKDSTRGTGLGLSTCQAIAHHHHGAIHVCSSPGAGACFSVYLPACPPPTATTRRQGELLLVVEDEPALLDLLEHALTQNGYRVLAAPDGQRALELYRASTEPVALVLTDMAMPHLDGAGLIRALHALDPELPILATSGMPLPPGIAGLRGFLPKPYDVASILHAIRQALHTASDQAR